MGKACHETIAHNFRQKQETACDLPLAECIEFFGSVLGRELEQIKLQKDEHPMELLELGTTMVAKYLGEAATLIQPAAVESRVAGIIGGVRVSGYVDLLDAEGRLIDSKSAIKPIKGIAHDHRLQLTSYDDHAGSHRRLPSGHRHERKDRDDGSKEFLRERKGPAIRGDRLSNGPGFHSRRNLSAATWQSVVFETLLRLLEDL
jgi:hypothetical protein